MKLRNRVSAFRNSERGLESHRWYLKFGRPARRAGRPILNPNDGIRDHVQKLLSRPTIGLPRKPFCGHFVAQNVAFETKRP